MRTLITCGCELFYEVLTENEYVCSAATYNHLSFLEKQSYQNLNARKTIRNLSLKGMPNLEENDFR